MAADKRTAYLQAYIQLVLFIPFLSTFFRTNPRDIVNAESMKIDIKRGTRKMAPVISNITQRGGKIEKSQYTQKEFTPPVVALGGDFAPGDLIEKVFGVDEYTSADQEYVVELMNNIMDTMMEIEGQINRTIEYQAAQILQTGEVYLYDDQGNIAYSIDYYPKATHFPTVTIPWSDEDANPDTDISNLIDIIRKDGKVKIRNIVFGKTALDNYLKNTKVDDKFDITRINSGIYDPREINDDVKLLGELLIGTDRLMAYVYEGLYDHPSTSVVTEFVDPEKVILLPDPSGMNVDMRKTYCRVPTVTSRDPRIDDMVPSNLNLEDRSYTFRAWEDKEADALKIEMKTRPLCIPVSIDAYGCLTTEL